MAAPTSVKQEEKIRGGEEEKLSAVMEENGKLRAAMEENRKLHALIKENVQEKVSMEELYTTVAEKNCKLQEMLSIFEPLLAHRSKELVAMHEQAAMVHYMNENPKMKFSEFKDWYIARNGEEHAEKAKRVYKMHFDVCSPLKMWCSEQDKPPADFDIKIKANRLIECNHVKSWKFTGRKGDSDYFVARFKLLYLYLEECLAIGT